MFCARVGSSEVPNGRIDQPFYWDAQYSCAVCMAPCRTGNVAVWICCYAGVLVLNDLGVQNMNIEYASQGQYAFFMEHDQHVSKDLIQSKIDRGEILVVRDFENVIGWLRFSYFWDNTPFMNMLYVDFDFRFKGIGKALVTFWEKEMKQKGFAMVMTSTMSNEKAQHFYRKMGYMDSGSLILDNTPLEIIFTKKI